MSGYRLLDLSHAQVLASAATVWRDLGDLFAQERDARDFGWVDDEDVTEAVQDAIDSLGEGAGTVWLPSARGLTSDIIVRQYEGQHLRGRGTQSVFSSPNLGTILEGDHVLGPVLRTMAGYCQTTDLTITASAEREAYDEEDQHELNLVGLLHDTPDDLTTQANGCVYARLNIDSQPSHGLVIAGPYTDSTVTQCHLIGNHGHGLLVDDGVHTGRTNLARPAALTITHVRSFDNDGHAMCIGGQVDGTSNGTKLVFRLRIENCDLFRCALEEGVRRSAHTVWMFVENAEILLNGIGGFEGSPGLGTYARSIDCLYIAGRDVNLRNNRYIDPITTAIHIANAQYGVGPTTYLFSSAFEIEGVLVSLSDTPEEPLNPAITYATGVSKVKVAALHNLNIRRLILPGMPGLQYVFERTGLGEDESAAEWYMLTEIGVNWARMLATIDNGRCAEITLIATNLVGGMLELNAAAQARGAAVVHFRCGAGEDVAPSLLAHSTIMCESGTVSGSVAAARPDAAAIAALGFGLHVVADNTTTENPKLWIVNNTNGNITYALFLHGLVSDTLPARFGGITTNHGGA